jgi:hypothetical protein
MISVFMPSIRTHLLEKWFSSLEESCNRHPFEAVVCGPFDPPEALINKHNFTFIKSFASPSVCAQIAAINCRYQYIYHTTDDVVFFKDEISNNLSVMSDDKIIGMRYREGQSYNGYLLDTGYWYASNAYSSYEGVNSHWGICVHFLMYRSLFNTYGGFDCRYQYLNHAGHDLLFRIQQNEQIDFELSSKEVSSADWMPETTGDHGPIHHAQIDDDQPLFYSDWKSQNSRGRIDINSYLSQPSIWTKRFTGQEKTYEHLNNG